MKRTLAALVSAAALVPSISGCGGHSATAPVADAGVTSVQGSIGGVSIATAYAVAIPDNSNATGNPANEYTALSLGIANRPLACNTPGLPNSVFIGISIKTTGPVPVGPGSYQIDADTTSTFENIAALITTDSTCAETSPSDCIGGTVTITAMTGSSVSGTFTLAFDSGEALEGTFAADICTTIPPSLNGTTC